MYEGELYIHVYRSGPYTCSCNINSGLEVGTSCMRQFTNQQAKTDTLRQKLPNSFRGSWNGSLWCFPACEPSSKCSTVVSFKNLEDITHDVVTLTNSNFKTENFHFTHARSKTVRVKCRHVDVLRNMTPSVPITQTSTPDSRRITHEMLRDRFLFVSTIPTTAD